MICPMTRLTGSAGANCSKSCQWWVNDRCDVNSIATSLREISTTLQNLTDKKVGEQNASGDPEAE